jgi:DNA repair protein RadC
MAGHHSLALIFRVVDSLHEFAPQSESIQIQEITIMETRYEIETIRVKLKLGEKAGRLVSSPQAAVAVAKEIFSTLDADQEHFVILALNTQNEINGFKVVASGAMDQVSVDPKIVFRSAVLLGAVGLIICHNHPSGHAEPSEEDKKLTRVLKTSADLLDIRLLDHMVLGLNREFSFLAHGLL